MIISGPHPAPVINQGMADPVGADLYLMIHHIFKAVVPPEQVPSPAQSKTAVQSLS